MTPEQQLQAWLIGLGGWATLMTALALLARRDFMLGLKKWFYLRTRKQPLKIRYFGPDKNVTDFVVPMKGKGETVTLFDRKLIFFKTKDGMTFFIDEAALRRGDDGINEISYSYKSVMPIDPTRTKEEIEEELQEFVKRIKSEEQLSKEDKDNTAQKPIEMDNLIRYTDPKRLNKFIDYTYLAAKADALAEATDVAKWVKITAIGVGIAIIGVVAIYYTLDGKVIPLIQQLGASISAMSSSITGAIHL